MLRVRSFEPRLSHLLLIVFVVLAFYGRTMDNYWIKDDLLISQFTTGGQLDWGRFKLFLWPSHMEREQFWRPLPILTGFADYSVWGTNPVGAHLQNTAWQALIGVLVYCLLQALAGGRARGAAFVASLAVVVNPIAPESVVWLLQRMVLMNAAFSLAAMLAWLKAAESGRHRWKLLGLGLLSAAILCKEIAVVLPACFFLIDLSYAPKGQGIGKRLRSALLWTIPNAIILGIYLGLRYLLWGRLTLKYAGLEPREYARHNQVFERVPDSLQHAILPVNEAVFGETVTTILRAAMALALGIAGLRALCLFVQSRRFRKTSAILITFGLLSFLPTLLIFWVDQNLFNARLFYLPGLCIAAIAGLSLCLSATEEETASPAPKFFSWGVTALLLVSYGLSLSGGLVAFEEAGAQVRGIQSALVAAAENDELPAEDLVLVAFDTPSMARGVPTLETSLQSAMIRPLAPHDFDVVALLETQNLPATAAGNARIWWERIQSHQAKTKKPWSAYRYYRCKYTPPGIAPLFSARHAATGARPVTATSPEDGLCLPNDSKAPVFEFSVQSDPAGSNDRYALVIDTHDGRRFQFGIHLGRNARRDGQLIRFDLAKGDPDHPELDGAWEKALHQVLLAPVPLRWHIETRDDSNRLVGVSSDRRLMIVNVRNPHSGL
ncbi:MAG: hypothetical protein V3W41_18580 [Planctomycetota bacterium]